MHEAEKKGVGVKVTPTIPQDIYKKLEADAEINGMKAATRIGQIVSLFYNNKLAFVDLPGVQNIVAVPTSDTSSVAPATQIENEKQEQNENEDKKQVSSEENEIQALNKSGKKSRRI